MAESIISGEIIPVLSVELIGRQTPINGPLWSSRYANVYIVYNTHVHGVAELIDRFNALPVYVPRFMVAYAHPANVLLTAMLCCVTTEINRTRPRKVDELPSVRTAIVRRGHRYRWRTPVPKCTRNIHTDVHTDCSSLMAYAKHRRGRELQV